MHACKGRIRLWRDITACESGLWGRNTACKGRTRSMNCEYDCGGKLLTAEGKSMKDEYGPGKYSALWKVVHFSFLYLFLLYQAEGILFFVISYTTRSIQVRILASRQAVYSLSQGRKLHCLYRWVQTKIQHSYRNKIKKHNFKSKGDKNPQPKKPIKKKSKKLKHVNNKPCGPNGNSPPQKYNPRKETRHTTNRSTHPFKTKEWF